MRIPSTLRRLPFLSALLALFGALTASASAETIVVDQLGFYFSSREIFIQPGDTVRWVWHDGGHTVTEGTDGVVNGNEAFHSALTSGTQVLQVTFTPAFLAANPRPGNRYPYFCVPHFAIGMNGGVTVVTPEPGASYCFGDGSGTACPCSNPSTGPVGCRNSGLKFGRLRANGTASVAADSLVLQMSGAPESGNVLFFQGTAQTNGRAGTVFGDGLRCASGSVIRLGIKTIAFGYTTYPQPGDLPVSLRGVVSPGDSRTYQVFYRDPPSACSGAQFNTSNGYAISWLP